MMKGEPRPRFDAVVIGEGGGDAERAIAAAGGQVVASVGWDGAAAIDVAPSTVVAVEAIGVSDDALAASLPRVAEVVAAHELPGVVALDERQIDIVASHLLGATVHLACPPDLADRITMLVLAAHQLAPGAQPFVGEGEAERLSRIADELARVTDLLSQLVRQEPRADALTDRSLGYAAPPADPVSVRADPAEIRRVIRARRARDKVFGARLFEDPAWDILLDLFAAHLEGGDVSVSSLCIAAAVAPTTALRWIGRMTSTGLLVRTQDAADKRRALITLSDRGLSGMQRYAATLRQQGLPFA